MNLLFEKQSPRDLWQDFGCIKDSSIESTIYDVEREIEKVQNEISNSKVPLKLNYRFSFQGQPYRIKYIPKEVLHISADDQTVLPFFLSNSIFQEVHLLFGNNEDFFIFYSDEINNKIDDNKSLNLNRILQTLYLFKTFPLFVKLCPQDGFSPYVGNLMRPKVHYTYNSRIEKRSDSRFTRLVDICYFIENNKFNSKNKPNLTFFVRDIYHFHVYDNLNFIICSEWPEETNRHLKLDFKNAKRYLMSIYQIQDETEEQSGPFTQNKFTTAFELADNHYSKFQKVQLTNDGEFEEDLALEGEISDMKIKVKFSPSNTILMYIAEHLTFDSEFDLLWHQFLKYVRKCIETRHEIQNVGFDSVDLNDCLLYQKLVLINIAIHKIKLVEKTSNYSLTSDMIEEADQKIRNAVLEIDSTITENMIVKLRKEIFPKIATNQSMQNYLRTKSGRQKEICEAAWKVVQSSWFDPEYLCECCADYLETLEPFEVLKPLLFILLIERYNDFYDSKIEISNQIEIYLNQLKFEMNILNIHEFVSRCKIAEGMIEELVKFKMFKRFFKFTGNFFNFQAIIDSLLDKKIVVIDKKDEKEVINNYFVELNESEPALKHENQFIVYSNFQNSGINLQQRTYILNDLTNDKVIIASATKEEFLY